MQQCTMTKHSAHADATKNAALIAAEAKDLGVAIEVADGRADEADHGEERAALAAAEGYATADAVVGVTLVERADGRFYSPVSSGPVAKTDK